MTRRPQIRRRKSANQREMEALVLTALISIPVGLVSGWFLISWI